VSAGGAIQLLSPEPGEKVSAKDRIVLKWKPSRAATHYDVAVSAVPFQFLSDRQIRWNAASNTGMVSIPLKDFKKEKWIYWLVRGKNASGREITTSEVGSFRPSCD